MRSATGGLAAMLMSTPRHQEQDSRQQRPVKGTTECNKSTITSGN